MKTTSRQRIASNTHRLSTCAAALLALCCSCSGLRVSAARQTHSRAALRADETIIVDARERSYTLALPAAYADSPSVPLIIAMHGGGGNSAQFEASSLLTPKADAAGFAVVYPNGVAGGALNLQTWNGGGCCGYAVEANIDDVKFVRLMIESLLSRYKIDPRRIYATGHSNGAIMAYRLACELPERIAAIAPNAGELMLADCAPARPVPILHMHSKLDTNVPYLGGVGTGISGVTFPSLETTMTRWVAINRCATPSTKVVVASAYLREYWGGCEAGSALEYYLTDDGGHAWPGGEPGSRMGDTPSKVINANDLLLAFFGAHSLPQPRQVWLPAMSRAR